MGFRNRAAKVDGQMARFLDPGRFPVMLFRDPQRCFALLAVPDFSGLRPLRWLAGWGCPTSTEGRWPGTFALGLEHAVSCW